MNVVVAMAPDVTPVAFAEYRAMNVDGRLKEYVKPPAEPVPTVSLRLQVLPILSLTKIETFSPPRKPAPVRVTVAPGM